MTEGIDSRSGDGDVGVIHLVADDARPGVGTAEWSVGVATGAEELRRRVVDGDEDCVVAHHDPPDVDAVAVVRELSDERPGIATVAVVPDDDAARRALDAGATSVYRTAEGEVDDELLRSRVETAVRALSNDPTGSEHDRERRLEELVQTTRNLMAAETTDEVMEVASDAAATVLDFPGTGVRRYDPEVDGLVSVSLGSRVTDIDERPTYDVDGTPHGRAFARGETVIDDIEPGDEYDRDPFVQTMYVPIGDHGVLSTGRTDRPFDEADVQLAELLATTTEAALNRAERQETLVRYREVLEAIVGMVYALDENGRFTLLTDTVADRLGYDRSELIGESVTKILDESAMARARDRIQELLDSDRDSVTFEGEVIPDDGNAFPVEIEISALVGDDGGFRGSVGLVRDVTELQEARQRLREQRDRFTYLFDNLPDAVVEVEFVDDDPVVRSVNPTFEDLFGFDADQVVGESLDDYVLPPENSDEGQRLNRDAASGDAVETEVRRQTAEGNRHFLLRVVPYEQTERGTRSFAIYTDITEQKQRVQSLQVINRVLRHNLRNELNIIAGYGQHLAREVEDEELESSATYISRTANDLAGLSEKGREIQSAIRADLDERTAVDLNRVVSEVVAEFDEAYPSATVTADLPDESIRAAGERLHTAVENVVENAIVHNAGDARVRVGVTHSADGWCEIRVTDDGPGIPDAERNVIAEEREITQLEHASGLGLWLVKWIVEGHGGRIAFAGNDLGGTTVVLRLPTRERD